MFRSKAALLIDTRFYVSGRQRAIGWQRLGTGLSGRNFLLGTVQSVLFWCDVTPPAMKKILPILLFLREPALSRRAATAAKFAATHRRIQHQLCSTENQLPDPFFPGP